MWYNDSAHRTWRPRVVLRRSPMNVTAALSRSGVGVSFGGRSPGGPP
jgi:hypothetical protein